MRFPLKAVQLDAAEVEAARDQERTLVQEIAEADEDMDEDEYVLPHRKCRRGYSEVDTEEEEDVDEIPAV